MTKTARRKQIMECVGFVEKRVDYHPGGYTYKRRGELLKVELRKILEYLGAWSSAYESQHKRAWRSHIRDAVGIDYDSQMGWESFSIGELTDIWREVRSSDE